MKFKRAFDAVLLTLVVDAGVSVVNAAARRMTGAKAEPAERHALTGLPVTRGTGDHGAGAKHSAALAGLNADTPSEIPAKGWKQIAKRVFSSIGEDRVMAEAASVTYYSLLAIFPAIAALISLYGLVADPATIGDHLASLKGVLPGGGLQIITDQVHALVTAPKKGLGLGFAVGLLTSIWSANAGVKSLFDALNSVYEEKEKRSFFHLTWLSLAFTLGALIFVILALAAVVVVPAVLKYVGMSFGVDVLLSIGRWPLLLAGIMLFLALTYRYGPSRAKAKWRWVSWGSAFAGVFWLGGSLGFSWYAANFGNYNKTYGSLGAVVGFMTWIWISTIIVLIGAELNAQIERQTGRDSTSGPTEKPVGKRGARQADTVAAA